MALHNLPGPIGIFDSGYGGLTVFKEIVAQLPQYSYVYLGDNARAPYGPRSFDTVYQYTWQCVQWFFKQNCPLVILACNTASAKALRTIQQSNLPASAFAANRVLGVIRPTAEVIGPYSQSGSIGILGTAGTVKSQSYPIEIAKFWPTLRVHQQACPMWVPLVENNEWQNPGAEYFVQSGVEALLAQDKHIDTVLLACTHYPLLAEAIAKYLPPKTTLLSQGSIVAQSLAAYLVRHPQMDARLSKAAERHFFTTDAAADFDQHASIFYGRAVAATQIVL
ncbi:MAG: glutamate racemase [Bacteroidetes bacterium]|nr:MAG: glutamate racemase [Bacteroidota bacterium]